MRPKLSRSPRSRLSASEISVPGKTFVSYEHKATFHIISYQGEISLVNLSKCFLGNRDNFCPYEQALRFIRAVANCALATIISAAYFYPCIVWMTLERDKRGHRICPNRIIIMYAVYEETTERSKTSNRKNRTATRLQMVCN